MKTNNKAIVRRKPNGRPTPLYRPISRPTGVSRTLPSKKRVTVVTTSEGSVQAAAAGFAACPFRLMDPTNAGLSGGTGSFVVSSPVGLADATAYATIRVKKIRIEATVSSLETATTLTFGIVFNDTDVSASTTTFAQAKANAIGLLHTAPEKIPPIGGNTKYTMPPVTLTPLDIVQDLSVLADRDFVTTINPSHTAPNQEAWGCVIVNTPGSGINLTNGLDVTLTVTQFCVAKSRLPGL